jgi:hypothetical protein
VEDKLYNDNPLPPLKQNKQSSPVFSTRNRINGEKNLDSWSLVLGTRELQMMIPLDSMGRQWIIIRLFSLPLPLSPKQTNCHKLHHYSNQRPTQGEQWCPWLWLHSSENCPQIVSSWRHETALFRTLTSFPCTRNECLKADNLLSSYITFLSKPMLLNFFIISRYVFVGKKIS